MAKSKSFFGLRTGSTRSLTFQVYRGLQITKDRVYRVANPRTEAQMKQRALIPLVAASRAALKGLVDHSFEGVNYGNDSLKKFSELNLRAGAIEVESYSPNGHSNPGFADLIVSQGSLGTYPYGLFGTAGNNDHTGIIFSIGAEGTAELKLHAAKKDDKADAIFQQIAAWGAANCAACAPGNQLTFLTVSKVGEVYVGKNPAALSTFDINRILFPTTGTPASQLSDVNGSYKVVEDVTEGAEDVKLANDVVNITISYIASEQKLNIEVQPTNNPKDSTCVGGTLIRSAFVNGSWKRTTSSITFPGDVDPAYTYEMWRSYYESTKTSAKYLNHGQNRTGIK